MALYWNILFEDELNVSKHHGVKINMIECCTTCTLMNKSS